jgi:hypothetical protein
MAGEFGGKGGDSGGDHGDTRHTSEDIESPAARVAEWRLQGRHLARGALLLDVLVEVPQPGVQPRIDVQHRRAPFAAW